MLRTVDPTLLARFASQFPTPARGIRITRRDGVTVGYTTADRNARIGGVLYQANRGLRVSRITTTGNFDADSLEVTGAITEDERGAILRGLYDACRWTAFDYDWKYPALPVADIKGGWTAQGKLAGIGFTLELLGRSAALRANEGRVVGPLCDVARLGGPRCLVDLAPFTEAGVAVTAVPDALRVTFGAYAEAAGAASYGWLQWTSGANAGQTCDIRQHADGGVMLLFEPLLEAAQVGDEATIVQGCDRSLQTCIDKFDNAINHQGFADAVTADEAYAATA